MERRKAIKGLAAALGGLVAIPGCSGEAEKTEVVGAMCYIMANFDYMDYVCSHCGNTIKDKYNEWIIIQINQIEEIVKKIKELGYDVVLDKTEFCPHCSKKNIENPELIFKIRFSDEADYHIVRSNIINEYQCLYEFLSNPDEFSGDKTIIQKMTGLGEDLKIKK
jgi:DNA-directed RNA polymerase subunit RPC12/RpoP